MIRLLVKTYDNHKKYLCKSESAKYMVYRGSGDLVTDDLAVIDTEVLFETEDRALFKEVAIYYSKLWNVAHNPLFLNKRYEEGDGGDTVSKKFWITNGVKDRYIDIGSELPDGWRKGRSTGAFKNPALQKELNARACKTTDKQREAARRMGLANKGKVHESIRGGKNPMSRPIVTPYGKFDAVSEAAKAIQIKRAYIDIKLKSPDFPDWAYL